MMTNATEDPRDALVREGRWPSRTAFDRYHAELFKDVSFADRRVLDVGGGIGTCSFLAAMGGAREIVCLDPEGDGSTTGTGARFRAIATLLGVDNVRLEPATLQTFTAPSGSLDVIIFHNSINHIDEAACVRLGDSGDARRIYRTAFEKLADLASPGADLVIADCTSQNLFPLLGLRHPISRSIEWEKHQPPEVWARELARVGFERPAVRWTSYNRLGSLGWTFTANRWAAFVLTGHFMLHMKRRR